MSLCICRTSPGGQSNKQYSDTVIEDRVEMQDADRCRDAAASAQDLMHYQSEGAARVSKLVWDDHSTPVRPMCDVPHHEATALVGGRAAGGCS